MKSFIVAVILGLGLFCVSTAEAARPVYYGVGVYVAPAPRYYRPYPYYVAPPRRTAPPRYYPHYYPHHHHHHPGVIIIR